MDRVDLNRLSSPEKGFQVLWSAFRGTFGRKCTGYEGLKQGNALGRKLEGVSRSNPTKVMTPDGPAMDEGYRDLKKPKSDRVLLLEGFERQKLLSMVKDEQMQWTYVIGPVVEEVIDLLESAPEVEVTKTRRKRG